MITLFDKGAYLLDGVSLIADTNKSDMRCDLPTADIARQATIAHQILTAHDIGNDDGKLKIKFDKLTSHDITYVSIIQTARASGLTEFPVPYVLTNCHNSLCAVGGTINEDDHLFGLSCAKRYGGVFVPPHQAVIHQYAREVMAVSGQMILGSDSHTRYGALGTMAIGEGGPELVKQLLGQTYDIESPDVVLAYLHGSPSYGVGPQDVALAIIGAVFDNAYVKDKIIEFVGPGLANLSMDFRMGIDVMTTETACLSSIWATDDTVADFYDEHGRAEAFRELAPGMVAYYDGAISIDLSRIEPMIAMPFHPAHVYTIANVSANPAEILREVEKRAVAILGDTIPFSIKDKIRDGKLFVEQGIIAGCAGGGFENICAAADILRNKSIGSDFFSLSIYPASMPVYMELIRNGCAADLIAAGAVIKTAFCGPCFGAGDTPAHKSLSIRHCTRNFPHREGSKSQSGQISAVALMDARSVAATAVCGGKLTSAAELQIPLGKYKYSYDSNIYTNRVFDATGRPDPHAEIHRGPGIKDWPQMFPLPEHLLLQVVAEIHDPVTTTDELIPSGETSSYRSDPIALAEYTLSRKDPAYVGLAKKVRQLEERRRSDGDFAEELEPLLTILKTRFSGINIDDIGIGSTIFAEKPGDGSAREQAASCQRVLGGLANISREYATKRYRSNLINWGMFPFLIDKGDLPFGKGDYIFVPDIRQIMSERKSNAVINAFTVSADGLHEFNLRLGYLTDEEHAIILAGCLINHNAAKLKQTV
ncbi:MAG: hydratase [Lachnospiraceae bacterium]|jgi:aconitate hydratase|nr:hydratase [Lachnospiraceae bacterium]